MKFWECRQWNRMHNVCSLSSFPCPHEALPRAQEEGNLLPYYIVCIQQSVPDDDVPIALLLYPSPTRRNLVVDPLPFWYTDLPSLREAIPREKCSFF